MIRRAAAGAGNHSVHARPFFYSKNGANYSCDRHPGVRILLASSGRTVPTFFGEPGPVPPFSFPARVACRCCYDGAAAEQGLGISANHPAPSPFAEAPLWGLVMAATRVGIERCFASGAGNSLSFSCSCLYSRPLSSPPATVCPGFNALADGGKVRMESCLGTGCLSTFLSLTRSPYFRPRARHRRGFVRGCTYLASEYTGKPDVWRGPDPPLYPRSPLAYHYALEAPRVRGRLHLVCMLCVNTLEHNTGPPRSQRWSTWGAGPGLRGL